MSEFEEEEMYLYLDFKGRLPAETFNTEVFFNIANLDGKHPLVQLGQSLFYGTYEDCVGTNLFFEEDEHSTENEKLLMKTPINLKYVTKQFKVLNMQWAKLPEDATVAATDDYDVKFKEDYEAILRKIEKGALKIENLELRQADEIEVEKNKEATEPVKPAVRSKPKKKAKPQHADVVVEKFTKLDALKQLAREPLKRLTDEETCEIPATLKASYVYHSFKNKLLQETFYFDPFTRHYNQDTLEGAVDINRCVRRNFTPHVHINAETKSVLLTLQNFESLSLPMRYCVLRRHMKKQRRYIGGATEKEVQQVTELGVNVRDSYKIVKVLAGDVKRWIGLKETVFVELKGCGGGVVVEKGDGGSERDEERSGESMSQ